MPSRLPPVKRIRIIVLVSTALNWHDEPSVNLRYLGANSMTKRHRRYALGLPPSTKAADQVLEPAQNETESPAASGPTAALISPDRGGDSHGALPVLHRDKEEKKDDN